MQHQKLTIVNFAERFRELVEASGLSQKELANRLAVSEGAIVNYKGGRIPKAEELLSISAYFGVTVEWLLCGEDAQASGPGGPGNAPMYNPGLGARGLILKSQQLEEEAATFRLLAERHQAESKELIAKAEAYEEWARSLLDPEPEHPADDWDDPE